MARPAPELAEHQQRDDRHPDVEEETRPGPGVAVEPPEEDETAGHRHGRAWDEALEGDSGGKSVPGAEQRPGHYRHREIDERELRPPQAVDERRLANALGRELEGPDQEAVGEEKCRDAG